MNDTELEQARAYGRYRLLDAIGRGSIAEVFKAKSFGVEGFEKTLVVKRIRNELARDPRFAESFVHEAKLAVRLSHANVVQVFDLGRVEDVGGHSYFMATEFVAGVDLHTLLGRMRRARAALPVECCLYLASEIAKSLDHAHRRRDQHLLPLGIVHRDLSPRNVLLSWEGEVKVSDFCIAKALYDLCGGKPDARIWHKYAYGSPEQARNEPVSAKSDVFGLGSLLYEALCGKNPFTSDTAVATLSRVAKAKFTPLSRACPAIAPELSALVDRALSRDPDARFESAAQLHEELMAYAYASGARFDADELAELLEGFREPSIMPSVDYNPLLSGRPRASSSPEPSEPSSPPVSKTGQPASSRTGLPLGSRSGLAPASRRGLGSRSGLFAPESNRAPSSSRVWATLPDQREASVLVLSLVGKAPAPPPIRERARQILLRYGGQVLRETGYEIVTVFGLEQSDGRDTENAVRCALVLVRSLSTGPVEARAGVDAGRLRLNKRGVVHDEERTNELIASARRLAMLAAQRVAIAAHAANNLRGLFVLEAPPVPDALDSAFFVGEVRSPQEAFGAFVGRKKELGRLGELLATASKKSLVVVGLVGDHGIGKTRLLFETERRIAKSAFNIGFYLATCPPRGREVPYSALVAMLRLLCGVREGDPSEHVEAVEPRLRALGLTTEEVQAVLAELGVTPPATRLESAGPLRSAVGRMFVSLAADRLHVFAWDNAQEMDNESAALLAGVTERALHSRAMLIFAARPREGAGYQSIPGYVQLELANLQDDDALRLVARRLGTHRIPHSLLEFVRERAGGHPMFIEELLHEAFESGAVALRDGRVEILRLDGALSVPRPLRTLLADRVRRLPDSERNLVVAAAVLGAPCDTSVLAAMLNVALGTVNALAEELEARELVQRDGPVSLSFSSPLLPEVVVGGLEPDLLIELHRRAFLAYQTTLGDRMNDQAHRVAHHLAEAGERERASNLFAKSGLYALETRRLNRATADLMRALELADFDAHTESQIIEWVSALSRAVRHVRSAARLPELVRRLNVRLEAARSMDPELSSRMAVDLALLFAVLHRYKDARRLLEQVVNGSGRSSHVLRAALTAEAEIAIQLGEFKTAVSALERARLLGSGDHLEQHRLLLATAQALGGAGEFEQALRTLVDAARLVPSDDRVLECERAKVRSLVLGLGGEWLGAANAAALATERARAAGLTHEVAVSLHNEAEALLRGGELPKAYALLQASLGMAGELGSERLSNSNRLMLAYLDALKGADVAQRTLGERLAHAEAQNWTLDVLTGRYLLGMLLAHKGDAIGAERELRVAEQLAISTGNRRFADDCGRELEKLRLEE